MSKIGGSDSKNPLYCSFCGKSQHEVRKLIAGPTVFICDECVELCLDIIGEDNKSLLGSVLVGREHEAAQKSNGNRPEKARRCRRSSPGVSDLASLHAPGL